MQSMNPKLRTLILMGVEDNGSYKPEVALVGVEEQMTPGEYKLASEFLNWCIENDKRFGHGSFGSKFREFQRGRKGT
jgi:hypothetical protein